MKFSIPTYEHPDFNCDLLKNSPDVRLEVVQEDGISPKNYHALSIYPEYFKINGKWHLAIESRMDTVAVIDDRPGHESIDIVEFRNLKVGDKVAVGRADDGTQGIYVWTEGFDEGATEKEKEDFAFRTGHSRETAFSIDYDRLYELLEYEKENHGHVTMVVGTAVALDPTSRKVLADLIYSGYIDTIFCGTETAAFDLEMGIFETVWGQEDFDQEQNTYKNMFKTINTARLAGSTKGLVESGKVKDGFIKACIDMDIPFILAGTIRDRYGLPETIADVYEAQDVMRSYVKKTTSFIMVGAILFTIATGNMTPSYTYHKGKIRPVYIYTIDVQEFAVNKLADRGSLTAVSIVTNAEDFMRNLGRALT